jgi:hypothetical protein
MFLITVVVGPVVFPLMFKQEDKVRNAEQVLNYNPGHAPSSSDWIHIEDDFGHRLACPREKMGGYICEDMDKSKLAHCERALHNQRTQNMAQKMAEADPALRISRGMNGPGVITPFPGMNH